MGQKNKSFLELGIIFAIIFGFLLVVSGFFSGKKLAEIKTKKLAKNSQQVFEGNIKQNTPTPSSKQNKQNNATPTPISLKDLLKDLNSPTPVAPSRIKENPPTPTSSPIAFNTPNPFESPLPPKTPTTTSSPTPTSSLPESKSTSTLASSTKNQEPENTTNGGGGGSQGGSAFAYFDYTITKSSSSPFDWIEYKNEGIGILLKHPSSSDFSTKEIEKELFLITLEQDKKIIVSYYKGQTYSNFLISTYKGISAPLEFCQKNLENNSKITMVFPCKKISPFAAQAVYIPETGEGAVEVFYIRNTVPQDKDYLGWELIIKNNSIQELQQEKELISNLVNNIKFIGQNKTVGIFDENNSALDFYNNLINSSSTSQD